MQSADRIVLTIGGIEYREWSSVSVTRSLEAAAASWQMTVSERLSQRGDPLGIVPGSACVVQVEPTSGQGIILPVVTGYVDSIVNAVSPDSHDVGLSGRSRTCDLLDCTIGAPHAYPPMSILAIAGDLASDYGVTVTADPPGIADRLVPRFAPDPVSTIYESIERLARMEALLVTDDVAGDLVLRRISADMLPVAELRNPGQVESASVTCDAAGLYTDYELIRQRGPYGADVGAPLAMLTSSAADDTLRRSRLLRLAAESVMTRQQANDRIIWESATRSGRATKYICTVGTWRTAPDGDLWTPGTVLTVVDEFLNVDTPLLLVSVDLTYDVAEGTHAILTLAPVAGYILLAPVEVQRTRVAGRLAPAQAGTPWLVKRADGTFGPPQ